MADQVLDESVVAKGTTSPFLPGTQIQYAWDSTSLGYYKTCPRLYQYVMLDGWAGKGESVHLRFGLEYHAALEQFDRLMAEGAEREDAIRKVVRTQIERIQDWHPDLDTKAGHYKNRDTLVSLVVDYLDHFADDPAQTYILNDGTPAVELSFRFELDWGPTGYEVVEPGGMGQPYLLCGHLDRVVDFNDQLLVMDRKTSTTTLSAYYFNQYEPHNQMTLYTLAGKIILNAPIRGVIIDAAQVLLEKPNAFARGFTYRTEDQLEEWLADLRVTLAFAESCATSGHFPMNDTSCDKFGGCRFRGICSKSPAVRDRFLAADFEKLEPDQRWNPMKPR
jgi:hypothetical protein